MKKNVSVLAVIVMMALAGFGALYFMKSSITSSESPASIIVGGPALEQSAFIYIAEDQGFFASNGLNVTIRDDYPNGVESVKGMLNNDIDISVSAEYPVVSAVFKKKKIRVIGTIDRYQNENIIGRKDRGIRNISDLKGKKMGYPSGTIVEFFLGRFLDLHGMSLKDVTLVDVKASQSVDAIAHGDVDAIIYFQPYVYAMRNRLGDNAIIWEAQSNQLMFTVIAGRNDWIDSHPEMINRFLKSLAQAEEYFIGHPDESKAIVQKRLNHSDAYMEAVWHDHQFSLTLDQSLIIAMNDEGRWMISNNLTGEKTLPYFRDYTYTKGMEEVKPEAVNIR